MSKEKTENLKESPLAVENEVCVVIPYSKALHIPMALLYAIRSLFTNLIGDFRLVVIGDKEDWFGPELEHIPSEFSAQNTNGLIDEVLSRIPLVENLSAKFAIMLPNIILLNKLSFAHMMIPKVSETGSFDTGLPFAVDVKKFEDLMTGMPEEPITLEACQKLSGMGTPIVVDWRKNEWLLPIVSSNPNPELFAEFSKSRLFLRFGNNGWSGFLESWLSEKFAGKSVFEV